MKILHVGLMVDGKDVGLAHELNKLGTYHEINPRPHEVLNYVREFAPHEKWDLAFFQIQAGNVIEPEVFKILKDNGTFTLNWSGDIRNTTERWFYETGADLTAFSNLRDVRNMRKEGFNADFLQIGIDPNIFHRRELGYVHDVAYMGNNYGRQFPLGNERLGLVANLQRMGYAVYGSYRGAVKNLNGNQLEESIIYNQSKIAINHSHFNEERYTSDRMFRILASGTMCLSHHYSGIESDFDVGYHLDTYRNLNEMKQKINYYLNNPEQRKRITENGYTYCHQRFSYKNMAENIISLYNGYK